MDYTAQGILQARILEWVAVPFSRGLSNPEIEPKTSTLQEDSLPAEPPGKPKNTGVGSVSLLQWIFLPPELNQGLLYCRWILYQLTSQASPYFLITPSICVSKIVDSVNRFKSSKKGNPGAISNRLEMKLLLRS